MAIRACRVFGNFAQNGGRDANSFELFAITLPGITFVTHCSLAAGVDVNAPTIAGLRTFLNPHPRSVDLDRRMLDLSRFVSGLAFYANHRPFRPQEDVDAIVFREIQDWQTFSRLFGDYPLLMGSVGLAFHNALQVGGQPAQHARGTASLAVKRKRLANGQIFTKLYCHLH